MKFFHLLHPFMRPLALLLTLHLTCPLWTIASEIDSFTRRLEILKGPADRSYQTIETLNHLTDHLLLLAIKDTHEDGLGCHFPRLERAVKERLSGPKFLDMEASYGVVEAIINEGEIAIGDKKYTFIAYEIPRKDSLYRDFSLFATPAIYMHMGDVIRAGNLVIGADKFGHFFGQGNTYFTLKKKYGEATALMWGHLSELGNQGLTTTGIYSFADLSSNYAGMIFWQRLVETHQGKGPYVQCKKGRWEKANLPFDWRHYITPAWDEGINCNFFRNLTLAQTFHQNLNKLSTPLSCPVDIKKCRQLQQSLGEKAQYLLSPLCQKAATDGPMSFNDHQKNHPQLFYLQEATEKGEMLHHLQLLIDDFYNKYVQENFIFAPTDKKLSALPTLDPRSL